MRFEGLDKLRLILAERVLAAHVSEDHRATIAQIQSAEAKSGP
jgi:hypothetical protein